MKNALLVGGIVFAMSAAPAFAQAPARSGQPGQMQGTSGRSANASKSASKAKAGSDQTFVTKAAEGGLAEVELGNLAKQKASSDQVKQFADRMVTDHSKANDELKTLAQSKNISLPTDLNAKDKAVKDRLSKLSGEQFDKAYMRAMVKDHTTDVNEFRRESQSAKDPDVKAFASKTLPTLEDHLKLAQQDAKAVATTGTKSSRTNKTGK